VIDRAGRVRAVTLMFALLAGSGGWPTRAAGEDWQVQRGNVTVMASGSADIAARAATRVLQMQYAGRWLFGWSSDFNPSSTLVFALPEAVIRARFVVPDTPASVAVHPGGAVGSVVVTPQMTLLMFPVGTARGHELDALQYLYGQALLRTAPANRWPECPKLGFGMLFAGAEFTGSTHIYLAGDVVRAYRALPPDQFLAADLPVADSQAMLDRRAYACYALARMMAETPNDQRASYGALFQALGTGAALTDAVPAPLGGSLDEFTKRYLQYVDQFQFQPRTHDIRVDLPDPLPAERSPEKVVPERMQAVLAQLCGRIGECRATAPATAH